MFSFITDTVENVLDVAGDLIEGELPSKRQVAKLVSDGISVYTISEITGFAVETIEQLLED